jgi:hypothetical protein
MSKHLTPYLETEASPEYLAWNAFLRAEHVKARVLVRIVNLGRLNIHARPSLSKYVSKFLKLFWIVIPNVSKISCCGIVE